MKNKILFCIFNYKENENAEFLYRAISSSFRCRIIDCDSGVRPNLFEGDTICLPNVFYGGMIDHAIDLARQGGYEYLFFICSDVRIKQDNLSDLLHILQIENFTDIGVYSPSHQADSFTTSPWGYVQKTQNKRQVPFVEGMLSMYKREVYEKIFPCKNNPLGWSIDTVACYFANQMNFQCIIDDRVCVYHPKGDTKKNEKAREQSLRYFAQFVENDKILDWRETFYSYSHIPELTKALCQVDCHRAVNRLLLVDTMCKFPKRVYRWIKQLINVD